MFSNEANVFVANIVNSKNSKAYIKRLATSFEKKLNAIIEQKKQYSTSNRILLHINILPKRWH